MRVRLKNRFGRRYMSNKEFLDYASDLDLLTDHLSSSLLEITEMHGIITPIARIRFPLEIARRWHKERYPQEANLTVLRVTRRALRRRAHCARRSIAISGAGQKSTASARICWMTSRRNMPHSSR